jgi:hypothetical protein
MAREWQVWLRTAVARSTDDDPRPSMAQVSIQGPVTTAAIRSLIAQLELSLCAAMDASRDATGEEG